MGIKELLTVVFDENKVRCKFLIAQPRLGKRGGQILPHVSTQKGLCFQPNFMPGGKHDSEALSDRRKVMLESNLRVSAPFDNQPRTETIGSTRQRWSIR